jgi:predicted N-acyltransferase
MCVLHLRLIIHLRLPKSPMDYFRMNLHAGIAYRFWSSFKGPPKLHFEMALHVGIVFRVGFAP